MVRRQRPGPQPCDMKKFGMRIATVFGFVCGRTVDGFLRFLLTRRRLTFGFCASFCGLLVVCWLTPTFSVGPITISMAVYNKLSNAIVDAFCAVTSVSDATGTAFAYFVPQIINRNNPNNVNGFIICKGKTKNGNYLISFSMWIFYFFWVHHKFFYVVH